MSLWSQFITEVEQLVTVPSDAGSISPRVGNTLSASTDDMGNEIKYCSYVQVAGYIRKKCV